MNNVFKTVMLGLLVPIIASANPIDRQVVVKRNNPIVTKADTLASLSVGNGHFVTTVDVTGLQSYPHDYKKPDY